MSRASRRRKRLKSAANGFVGSLLSGMASALTYFAMEQLTRSLTDEQRAAIAKGILPPPAHPEAAEPIETKIDEHQLGRSELVREISNPPKEGPL